VVEQSATLSHECVGDMWRFRKQQKKKAPETVSRKPFSRVVT